MPLANGAKFAGYTIERQLGAGGMGEVYLAQHPRLPRRDAIKVLKTAISSDPDYIERFNREADLASKLWHPHIVGILDRGKYRGRLWISMDFVDGDDASQLLDEHPDGMPVDDALAIVEAVASALDLRPRRKANGAPSDRNRFGASSSHSPKRKRSLNRGFGCSSTSALPTLSIATT